MQLNCGVDANPEITSYYWLKNVTIISSTANSSKYSGGTLGSRILTIFRSTFEDSGNYTCVAGNSVGNRTSDPVVLSVTGNFYW